MEGIGGDVRNRRFIDDSRSVCGVCYYHVQGR